MGEKKIKCLFNNSATVGCSVETLEIEPLEYIIQALRHLQRVGLRGYSFQTVDDIFFLG